MMKWLAVVFLGLVVTVGAAMAGDDDGAALQAAPAIGSRNVAIADPAVPRPGTQPCVVELLPRQVFGERGDDTRMDAKPHTFRYTPPAGCPGPWAKVVLEAGFSVGEGHQYDRTASIWLNGVNLYFGTTEEPSPGTPRSWKIQRDLTDYASLFRQPGAGRVLINNWLGPVFGSTLHADARLLFYPASTAFPAPVTPDRVYALNDKRELPAKLDQDHDRLSRRIAFPGNTTRVYLDLFAQPQAHDEFYYVCLDDAVLQRIGTPGSNGSLDRSRTCGGGSFREILVRVDGHAAGLAPIVPWVYTGGLDPFLWQPTPGAEALNFMPYRVDLSPFAGLVSDGAEHTISVEVLGTPDFFSVAGALLVYQDHEVLHTGGKVTGNTLAAVDFAPTTTDTLAAGPHGVHGDALTRARQHYVITGYVDTGAGRVQSRVDTTVGFDNTQQFAAAGVAKRRHVTWQSARVDTTSSTRGPGARPRSLHRTLDYTLEAHTLSRGAEGGPLQRAVQLRQRFERHIVQREEGLPLYLSDQSNTLVAAGGLDFERGKRTTYRSHDQSSTQDFRFSNSLGDCYRAVVGARDREVAGYHRGQGCIQPRPMHWFVHPDGSPDSFGWRGLVRP